MTKVKSVTTCKTARDFERAIHESGIDFSTRQNGTSHKVYDFGGKIVPIPQHNGDIPTGTRHSIAKMLMIVGLSTIVPFMLCSFPSYFTRVLV